MGLNKPSTTNQTRVCQAFGEKVAWQGAIDERLFWARGFGGKGILKENAFGEKVS